MLGQAVGPVLGGILTHYLGWRSIFYFLFILAGMALLIIILFLPETLRSISCEGLTRWGKMNYCPVLAWAAGNSEMGIKPPSDVNTSRISWRTFVEPLGLLRQRDVFVTLAFGSVVYAVWSMITSSTTQIFIDAYALNDLQIGLAFLPNGRYLTSETI